MKPLGAPGEICLPLDPGTLGKGPIWIRIRMEDKPVPSPVAKSMPMPASSERYMVVRQGCQFGPFAVKDLRWLVSMGTLQADDEVMDEHGKPLRMLSDVVATVPYLPAPTRVTPVVLPVLDPNEEADEDGYYYPPFSGLHWTVVAAAACGILAVVLSLPRLSLFVPACVLLSAGFLLAVRSCVIHSHAGGVLVPALSLWMVFLFHADRVDWVPFQGKTGRTATVESRTETTSKPFSFLGWPSRTEPAETTKPAEAVIPESSVVWVEYKSGP